MKKLSHIDKDGKASMVDVTGKTAPHREAVAKGAICMNKETLKLITDNRISKDKNIETARHAGIMAAKRTYSLIPLCHQLNLTKVSVDFKVDKRRNKVDIEAKAICIGQTGVEMEALTAVSVAALTIYDMCKAVDKAMIISDILLLKKSGGKSGEWKRK